MEKFSRLAAHLQEIDLVGVEGFHIPSPATRTDLIRAHEAAYVDAVMSQTITPAQERRIGFAVTRSVAERSIAATGGTLLTARLALRHGLACNTTGGSHHAARVGGAGFCVFNDVAVAALALLGEGAVRRVLVIDLDVHQGDGTADIFASDPRVFCLSIHCEANFPTRKIAGDLDVGLSKGTGDHDYLAALDRALESAYSFAPDLAFFNAGVDPHKDDALGLLSLTDEGLWARERRVIDSAMRFGVPLACVMGGGYAKDIDALARRHAIVHRVAANAAKA
jgi:acetoin utilization deacetylase AcuC-like enzyme